MPSVKIECDPNELTLRIAEACIGVTRPTGKSAADSLRQIREQANRDPFIAEALTGFDKAAVSVFEYFGEISRSAFAKVPAPAPASANAGEVK